MSQENMWKIGHPELDISTVEIISVIKWGNEQTDRNTQNLRLFRTSVQTSKECLKKIWERWSIKKLEYIQ